MKIVGGLTMGSSLRHLPISATLGMLLVGCGPALGQSAPSGSPSFQERIKEVARALQNQPSLKDFSEQQRIDRVEFVVGNTLFILLFCFTSWATCTSAKCTCRCLGEK